MLEHHDAAAGPKELSASWLTAPAMPNLERMRAAKAAAVSMPEVNLAASKFIGDTEIGAIRRISAALGRLQNPLNKSTALTALAALPRFGSGTDYVQQLPVTLGYPRLQPKFLAQLAGTPGVLADLSRMVADIQAMNAGQLTFSARAVDAFSSYVDALTTLAAIAPWREAVYAGHGTLALAVADRLLDAPANCEAVVADQVDGIAVEPWDKGMREVREELSRTLANLDPEIVNLLDGAWVDVQKPSPGAVVKISSCAVEALDRALRMSAPDRQVLAWAADRDPCLLGVNGRPTRGARVRYLLRNRKGDQKLVETQVDAVVNELIRRLQAAKHASVGDVPAVRALLVCVESILGQLYLVQD